jgi:hypothetical protein
MTETSAPISSLQSEEAKDTKMSRGPVLTFIGVSLLFIVMAIGLIVFGVMKSQDKKQVSSLGASEVEINRLRAENETLRQKSAVPVQAPGPETILAEPLVSQPPVYSGDLGLLGRLSERVDRLEANQRLLIQAASAATAAAGLQQAAKGSQPFLSELADVEKSLTDSSVLIPLRPLAEKGVPSEVSLAVEFSSYAALAQAASKAQEPTGILARLSNMLNGLITVRRIDSSAKGVDAILLHAQARLDEGDLEGALGYVNILPSQAKSAMQPWLTKAEARSQVNTLTRKITVDSLSRLSQANYSTQNIGQTSVVKSGGAL